MRNIRCDESMYINTAQSLSASLRTTSKRAHQVAPSGYTLSEFTNSLLAFISMNSQIVDTKLNVNRLDIASLCFTATRDFFLSYPIEKRGVIELTGSDFNSCAEGAIQCLREEGWTFRVCSLSDISKCEIALDKIGLNRLPS